MGYIYNSTIERKTPMKRGGKLKRSSLQRSRKPMKKKREPPALTKVKRRVRERDNYTCQFPGCGRQSKGIDVHHIAKASQRPDLKFDPANMTCLCRPHHQWIDRNHDKAVAMELLSVESYELAKKQERQRVA